MNEQLIYIDHLIEANTSNSVYLKGYEVSQEFDTYYEEGYGNFAKSKRVPLPYFNISLKFGNRSSETTSIEAKSVRIDKLSLAEVSTYIQNKCLTIDS